MNLVPRNTMCVLKEDLGLRAYKRYTGHSLTLKIEKVVAYLQ